MRGRTIRRAVEERWLREQVGQLREELETISLGSRRIEPKSVLRAAALERGVGDYFLKALPRLARTPGEETALSPLLKRLNDLHD
jgi:hypothetical protein